MLYVLGGAYVTLEHGDVRYFLLGPEDGQKVVLVHGLQTPCVVWEAIVNDLVQRGYPMSYLDNYGRGYSDGPDVTNDESLYTGQLYQLLKYLDWSDVFLVGYSMGGSIATAFTRKHPHLINRLVLIAPAGLIGSLPKNVDPTKIDKDTITGELSVIGRITKNRYLLPILMGAMSIVRIKSIEREGEECCCSYYFLPMAHCPSTVRAIALTVRDYPLSTQHATYRDLGRLTDIPVIAIWGTKDPTVPYADAALFRLYVPHAELVTIEGGTHVIVQTHHDMIMSAMDRFFE
ncbi:Alpha/Beta hydrolase protein [Syncephalis plumigaleata]|nr:Alpha/Beta hydrolase protein [Syncephalis plumigaleata]